MGIRVRFLCSSDTNLTLHCFIPKVAVYLRNALGFPPNNLKRLAAYESRKITGTEAHAVVLENQRIEVDSLPSVEMIW